MTKNNQSKAPNSNRRFIGKVKNQQGQFGAYQTIYIDNPNPMNADNQTPNPYYNGSLLWLDNETGKRYYVKQLAIRNVGEKSKSQGYVKSIAIDLDNAYHVQEA